MKEAKIKHAYLTGHQIGSQEHTLDFDKFCPESEKEEFEEYVRGWTDGIDRKIVTDVHTVANRFAAARIEQNFKKLVDE